MSTALNTFTQFMVGYVPSPVCLSLQETLLRIISVNTVTCCHFYISCITFCLVAKTCEKGTGHQTLQLHLSI